MSSGASCTVLILTSKRGPSRVIDSMSSTIAHIIFPSSLTDAFLSIKQPRKTITFVRKELFRHKNESTYFQIFLLHILTIYYATYQYAILNKPYTGSKYIRVPSTSGSAASTPRLHPHYRKQPSPSMTSTSSSNVRGPE